WRPSRRACPKRVRPPPRAPRPAPAAPPAAKPSAEGGKAGRILGLVGRPMTEILSEKLEQDREFRGKTGLLRILKGPRITGDSHETPPPANHRRHRGRPPSHRRRLAADATPQGDPDQRRVQHLAPPLRPHAARDVRG